MLFYTKNQETPFRSSTKGNAYVAGIVDSEGKLVPKSDANTVRIPFDSEYGILLKNTTGLPCAVTIEIDGTSIVGESKIQLDPNSKVIIDRFCIDGDLKKGKKFKFVSKDSENVQDPGSKENGNVIITFIPVKNRHRSELRSAKLAVLRDVADLIPEGPFASAGYTAGLDINGSVNIMSVINPNINPVVPMGFNGNLEQNNCRGMNIPVSDIGATVEGKESNQIFKEGKKLELDVERKSVISFSIKGEVEAKKTSAEGKYRCKAGFSLDRSSSMSSKRDAAIEGFNNQLSKLKESPDNVETTVTFGTFSSEADPFKFKDKPVALIPDINRGNYMPDGSTAMLDGVGEMIEALYTSPDSQDENTSFLVVIVTDGEENNSSIYDWEDISHLITRLQNTGRWTFVYLGTNQDLAEVQKNMGLSAGNVRLFNNDSEGYSVASEITGESTGHYLNKLSRGIKAADNFYDK